MVIFLTSTNIRTQKKLHRPKGFIAIVSLLIVFSVSIMIAFSLLKDGIDNVALSLNSIHYEKAKINATICLEDALIRIKREDQFNGNINYVFNEDADEYCQTTLSWSAFVPAGMGVSEAQLELMAFGHSKGFERNFQYQLLIRQHEVNHTDGSLTHANNIHILSINEILN